MGWTRGAVVSQPASCRTRRPSKCGVAFSELRDATEIADMAVVPAPSRDASKTPGYARPRPLSASARSEEHTSELQSLMRISYAVFCLKKKNTIIHITKYTQPTQNYTYNTH